MWSCVCRNYCQASRESVESRSVMEREKDVYLISASSSVDW